MIHWVQYYSTLPARQWVILELWKNRCVHLRCSQHSMSRERRSSSLTKKSISLRTAQTNAWRRQRCLCQRRLHDFHLILELFLSWAVEHLHNRLPVSNPAKDLEESSPIVDDQSSTVVTGRLLWHLWLFCADVAKQWMTDWLAPYSCNCNSASLLRAELGIEPPSRHSFCHLWPYNSPKRLDWEMTDSCVVTPSGNVHQASAGCYSPTLNIIDRIVNVSSPVFLAVSHEYSDYG